MTDDADLSMLVGALDDERTGLDEERDAQQADDLEDAAAGGSDLTAPPPAALHRRRQDEPSSGDILAPEVMKDADPAMLVGALDDERTGLDEERDPATAERDDLAE
ncbi:MAG TPA: hypothetical protein VFA45_16125 [Actinomycetes bacterium]|nr:hypothetical protein [Actinomycetes bacterium]